MFQGGGNWTSATAQRIHCSRLLRSSLESPTQQTRTLLVLIMVIIITIIVKKCLFVYHYPDKILNPFCNWPAATPKPLNPTQRLPPLECSQAAIGSGGAGVAIGIVRGTRGVAKAS